MSNRIKTAGFLRREEAKMRLWFVATAVVAGDQVTKFLVRIYLPQDTAVAIWPPYLFLTNVQNPGGAFGILAQQGALITVLSVVVVVAAALFSRRLTTAGYAHPAGLILGGTCGNLVDRLRLGQVVDFVDFSFWPAFNLADVALTVGVLWVFWLAVRSEGRRDTGCS